MIEAATTSPDSFEIKLPQFEGPFDLLLFFIQRDELDIYNIPIATITNDFFEYISHMHRLNIDVASEFILVAATLMRVKAKMLLPRPEIDDDGNEVDPREDLVAKLIAYRQFKQMAEEFRLMQDDRMLKEKRGNLSKELMIIASNTTYADELNHLTLFKLLTTFEKVLKRFNEKPVQVNHTVIQLPYTIEEQRSFINKLIKGRGKVEFTEVLKNCSNKYQLIFTFLAMLELIQERIVQITLGLGFNNFWISEANNPTDGAENT
ncbi:MAG: segregation and condensation protein A [Bacteroidia bacterium]